MPAFQKLTASTYALQILAKNKYLLSDIIKIITIKEKCLGLNAKLEIIHCVKLVAHQRSKQKDSMN
jgi:hypothetical protein